MSENRVPSERYADMAHELIESEPLLAHLRGRNAAVAFLSSDYAKQSKGRPICGECEKVPAKWRWAVPCDFTITVYEPNCAGMDDEQLRILLLHELMHVGIAIDKDGNEAYSIVPHDLEDFRAIVGRYGPDWAAR